MFLIPSVKFLPRYWDPTQRTHLTHIARQLIVDRPDDGCIAETRSLVLLTYIPCCARLYSSAPMVITHNGMDLVKIYCCPSTYLCDATVDSPFQIS
jgi:hypothetical protein